MIGPAAFSSQSVRIRPRWWIFPLVALIEGLGTTSFSENNKPTPTGTTYNFLGVPQTGVDVSSLRVASAAGSPCDNVQKSLVFIKQKTKEILGTC